MSVYTLGEIAKTIDAELNGDPNHNIAGVSTLQSANEKQISFLDNTKYQHFLTSTKAAAVILSAKDAEQYTGNALIVENPYFAFAQVASLFTQLPQITTGIHSAAIIGKNCKIDPSAKIAANVVIDDDVTIGANTHIHPNCVIGKNCRIGTNCCLWPNVTLYYETKIGNQVNIHSGAVLGADGFGWAQHKEQWHKVPQLGGVVVEDDADIGANTTIDRGTLDNTIIETGVKLDNHVQIAHNVKVGAHTIIAGLSGIAGSTTIGKHCIIGGCVAIAGHLNITDHVILTGTSVVSRSIKEPEIYSSGVGLMKNREWRKNAIRFYHLNEMAKRLKKVEKTLQELDRSNNHD
jgi:UDP-3-O-[3-hydroxymyristoyl] glucosamine N-acyltransferase